MTDKEAAERFWNFALSFYCRDAAREAFLRLQDRAGADVPMLLWCLWLGSEKRTVPQEAMRGAVAFSAAWRGRVVEPLRTVRRTLKPGMEVVPFALSEEARALIGPVEQALEKIQMTYLAQVQSVRAAEDGNTLIANYAAAAGLSFEPADVAVITEEA